MATGAGCAAAGAAEKVLTTVLAAKGTLSEGRKEMSKCMNGSGIALSTDCRKQRKKNLMILSLDEDYSENEQRGHSSRVFKTKLIVQ